MFEKLFVHPKNIARHRNAPYAEERERYLEYYAGQGHPRTTLLQIAAELLRVACRLNVYPELRVTPDEIKEIANRCIGRQRNRARIRHGMESRQRFTWVATGWLRFLGRLREPNKRPVPFLGLLEDFATWMEHERGLSQQTIHMRRQTIGHFLRWYGALGRPLSEVQIKDIDTYLATYGAKAWSRITVALRASVLRSFFRHAARRGWCRSSVANAIQGPRLFRHENIPMGPSWEEVQRLLSSMDTNRPSDVRNRAMTMLFAIYGLRSGTVANLQLEDIDWERDQILVRRTKQRRSQTYPLVPAVGNAIIHYLKTVRPECPRRELFLRLRAPFRPLSRGGLFHLVSDRMAKLGINPPHRGPHSLRHACATHLLAKNSSLKEIGDLLGHRRQTTTQVYAKVDLNGLRKVATFDLGGVL